jgi:hypothetical protein
MNNLECNLIGKTLILMLAILFTIPLIGRLIHYHASIMINRSVNIPFSYSLIPAMMWSAFYLVKNIL